MDSAQDTPANSPSDVQPPPSAPRAEAAPVPDPKDLEIADLSAQLEAAQKRVNELAHAVQAGEKDREAFKQRVNREREQMLDLEKGKVALALLEAVDQLDLCLQTPDSSPLYQGVKLIRASVLKQAEGVGIEPVELLDKPFDPNFAEATDMEITPLEAHDGHVVKVLKAAYQLKGRVIRPGVVKVAKYVKPADA